MLDGFLALPMSPHRVERLDDLGSHLLVATILWLKKNRADSDLASCAIQSLWALMKKIYSFLGSYV